MDRSFAKGESIMQTQNGNMGRGILIVIIVELVKEELFDDIVFVSQCCC